MSDKITCLIPTYNEGSRLLATVNYLQQVPEISRILIVDDGSTDGSLSELKQAWPKLSVLRLPSNLGKSAAVRKGVEKVITAWTLLFDADLTGITPVELNAGLRFAIDCPQLAMLIFRRLRSPLLARLVNADLMLSGERLVSTKLLYNVTHASCAPENYNLEVALNQHCLTHRFLVRSYNLPTQNTFKIHKLGVIRGLIGDMNTVLNAARYIGYRNYLRQVSYFRMTDSRESSPAIGKFSPSS